MPTETASDPKLLPQANDATVVDTPGGEAAPGVVRLFGVVSLLMALPAILCFLSLSWIPMLRTVRLSLQEYDIITPATFVGLQNYLHIFDNPASWMAIRMGVGILFVRTLVVFALFWLLWLTWQRRGGAPMWLVLMAVCPLAFLSPVGTSFVWRLLGSKELGPLAGILAWDTAKAWLGLLMVDGLHVLAISAAVGLVVYRLTPFGAEHGDLIWLSVSSIALLVAAANGLQLFAWSYVITEGGPTYSTTTWSLLAFREQFNYFRLGSGAAHTTLQLICIALLAWFVWLILRGAKLRLVGTSSASLNSSAQRGVNLILLLLGLLPALIILLPQLWNWRQFASAERVSPALSDLPWALWTINELLPTRPFLIWVVQLPIAVLAAYGLTPWLRSRRGLLRGWLWLFILAGMVEIGVIAAPKFTNLRYLGWLDTSIALWPPLLISGWTVVILVILLAGLTQQAAERGATVDRGSVIGWGASWSHVLTVVFMSGVVSTLLTYRQFLWPLLVINTTERYTLEPGLWLAIQQSAVDAASLVPLVVWPLGIVFAVLLSLATILLLRRVRLAAGA